MTPMHKREVYMNRLQQRIYYSGARHQRVLAARRFGKTDGTAGPHIGRISRSMPQGAGLWIGNSRKQLFTRTTPATLAAMERFWGYRQGEHIWWGQPPKKFGIPNPIITPKDWSHCITFFNAFVWHLISLEVKGSANSLTVNAHVWDEARFGKKSKYDAEVSPTLSGITHPLGDPRFTEANPYYKSTLFMSDAALTSKDNWMEKEEDICKQTLDHGPFEGRTYADIQRELDEYADQVAYFNELLRAASMAKRSVIPVSDEKLQYIRTIADACQRREGPFKILPNAGVNKQNVTMLVSYKLLSPDDAELLFNHEFLISHVQYFTLKKIQNSPAYKKQIEQLRCNGFSFYRATTFDNVDLLGFDYIRQMKRDLPPLVFAISILNQKKSHSSNGFYSALDIENIHGYLPQECPAFEKSLKIMPATYNYCGGQYKSDYESPDWNALAAQDDCTLDGDVQPRTPLSIALDYNANINTICTGQTSRNPLTGHETLWVLSSMFVKYENKLMELMNKWCDYYEPHRASCRQVTYYYDSTAKHKGYAIAGQQDFKDVVIEVLRKRGWEVHAIDMGRPMAHETKYTVLNQALKDQTMPAIRINRENNESLIISMENAEVLSGYKAFHKDKTEEKYVETEQSLLQNRTDMSDAFDSLYLGEKFFKNRYHDIGMPTRRR